MPQSEKSMMIGKSALQSEKDWAIDMTVDDTDMAYMPSSSAKNTGPVSTVDLCHVIAARTWWNKLTESQQIQIHRKSA